MKIDYFWYWIFNIIKKTIIFLHVFIVLLGSIYILGNFQNFTDSSQLLLLFFLEASTLINGILCAYFCGYFIVRGTGEGKFRIKGFLTYLAGALINIGLLTVLKIILSWIQPKL